MNLEILKCPISSETLKEASLEILQKINAENKNTQKLEKGLVNQSENIFYPIFGKVIVLLSHYATQLKDNVDLGSALHPSFNKKNLHRSARSLTELIILSSSEDLYS